MKPKASHGNVAGPAKFIFLGYGSLQAQNASIEDRAHMMQSLVMDRPVLDQSGLSSRYDFSLKWTPDSSRFGGKAPASRDDGLSAPPSLYTVLEEQLGLHMGTEKLPCRLLVVDHIAQSDDL